LDNLLDISIADIKLNIVRQIDNLPEQELFKISDLVRQYLSGQTTVAKKKRQFGSMKGLVLSIETDFDAPLEDFKEYM